MSLSDKILNPENIDEQRGAFTNTLRAKDVREAVRELKKLAFGWMSGGCDEELCERKWNEIVGEKLC